MGLGGDGAVACFSSAPTGFPAGPFFGLLEGERQGQSLEIFAI